MGLRAMAMKGYSTISKLAHYWNLIIRLFSFISRTLVGDALSLLLRCSRCIVQPPTDWENWIKVSVQIYPKVTNCVRYLKAREYNSRNSLIEMTSKMESKYSTVSPPPTGLVIKGVANPSSKSWKEMLAFNFAFIPSGKAWTYLFSSLLRVIKTYLLHLPCLGN